MFSWDGRTDIDICPVVAVLAYMAVCPAVQGPLFIYADRSPLPRDKLVDAVRMALEQAGVPAA